MVKSIFESKPVSHGHIRSSAVTEVKESVPSLVLFPSSPDVAGESPAFTIARGAFLPADLECCST